MPPPKHERDHERDHDRKHPKSPKPHGPKERELAVSLTVAILGAAKIDGPLESVEAQAVAVYRRMYALVTGGASRVDDTPPLLRLGPSNNN